MEYLDNNFDLIPNLSYRASSQFNFRKMIFEIKNVGWFFAGLIILIVGIFIVLFDYPQLQYFENLEEESYYLLDEEEKSIHQRLKIEYLIGVTILFVGIGLCGFSFIQKN